MCSTTFLIAEFKSLCPGGPGTVTNENTTMIKVIDSCKLFKNYCVGGRCESNGQDGLSCDCPTGYFFNTFTRQCEGTFEFVLAPSVPEILKFWRRIQKGLGIGKSP